MTYIKSFDTVDLAKIIGNQIMARKGQKVSIWYSVDGVLVDKNVKTSLLADSVLLQKKFSCVDFYLITRQRSSSKDVMTIQQELKITEIFDNAIDHDVPNFVCMMNNKINTIGKNISDKEFVIFVDSQFDAYDSNYRCKLNNIVNEYKADILAVDYNVRSPISTMVNIDYEPASIINLISVEETINQMHKLDITALGLNIKDEISLGGNNGDTLVFSDRLRDRMDRSVYYNIFTKVNIEYYNRLVNRDGTRSKVFNEVNDLIDRVADTAMFNIACDFLKSIGRILINNDFKMYLKYLFNTLKQTGESNNNYTILFFHLFLGEFLTGDQTLGMHDLYRTRILTEAGNLQVSDVKIFGNLLIFHERTLEDVRPKMNGVLLISPTFSMILFGLLSIMYAKSDVDPQVVEFKLDGEKYSLILYHTNNELISMFYAFNFIKNQA